MLKSFVYLDEEALDSYLSALEDGLRTSSEQRIARSQEAAGSPTLDDETATTRADTPSSRFERLQRLARIDLAASGWIDVLDPSVDLDNVANGSLVSVNCEIHVPQIIRMLSPVGGIAQAIGQFEAFARAAPAFGSEVSGLPPQGQIEAMKLLGGSLGGDLMLVGEPSVGDWRVAGKLSDRFLVGEIEGTAYVVGKVVTQWGRGAWKPLLALPGMNLLSRDKRREMERKGPSAGQEENWLEGPSMMLEVLAVYR